MSAGTNPRVKWWKLPASHPLRIRREFEQARAAYRIVKSEVDGEPSEGRRLIEDTYGVSLAPSAREIEAKRRRYERKRAAWDAAGRLDKNGKRTQAKRRAKEG